METDFFIKELNYKEVNIQKKMKEVQYLLFIFLKKIVLIIYK